MPIVHTLPWPRKIPHELPHGTVSDKGRTSSRMQLTIIYFSLFFIIICCCICCFAETATVILSLQQRCTRLETAVRTQAVYVQPRLLRVHSLPSISNIIRFVSAFPGALPSSLRKKKRNTNDASPWSPCCSCNCACRGGCA